CNDCAQQIGDKYHPGLYLDGIDTVPIEEMQRKILLELLVEYFYSPSSPIDFFYVPDGKFKIIGQQGD
ncbi:hypothetical protein RF400_14025, partial [Acinetobacter baumannii]|nr:hypothetical protein [Acinetobacter baumannii]